MDENQEKEYWESRLPEIWVGGVNGRFIDGLSVEDMERLRWYLNGKADHLNIEIQEAKSRAHNGNGRDRYAPTEWWVRVNLADKITRRQIARLTALIAKARRDEQRTFEALFVKVCRESLDTAVFQSLMTQAQLELAGE